MKYKIYARKKTKKIIVTTVKRTDKLYEYEGTSKIKIWNKINMCAFVIKSNVNVMGSNNKFNYPTKIIPSKQ